MTLLLRERDVEDLLTMAECIAAVEEAMREYGRGNGVNYSRQRIRLPGAGLQTMVAAVPSLGIMGYKAYPVSRAGVRMLVMLYSVQTGELLAIIEANKLGQMRTGAATGVATKYMARPDAATCGIYGTGFQARSQLEAVAAVRNLKGIKAYGRSSDRLHTFCREMTKVLETEVSPALYPEEVAQGQDIVITATSASDPVLLGEWLSAGCHVNAIGGNHWQRREIDEEAVRRADVIVCDTVDQAKIESGDLIWAYERAAFSWSKAREMGQMVAGLVPGRDHDDDITLFESHGLAIWDLAAGAVVYRRAREDGRGEEIRL